MNVVIFQIVLYCMIVSSLIRVLVNVWQSLSVVAINTGIITSTIPHV
jgi:hypothetical protein